MKAIELVNQFDFARVHKVMAALNWQWCEEGVPGVASLVQTATRLLRELEKSSKDTTSIGTGGFRASRYKNEEGRWIYTLEFIAASISTDEVEE